LLQLISTLLCEVKRGFVDPPKKWFLWSKLPCLEWRSADFYKVIFPKNIFRTCANILVLVLRFLWFRDLWTRRLWVRIPAGIQEGFSNLNIHYIAAVKKFKWSVDVCRYLREISKFRSKNIKDKPRNLQLVHTFRVTRVQNLMCVFSNLVCTCMKSAC
jgi:hypothetical protein